jgi:hypothetical protein
MKKLLILLTATMMLLSIFIGSNKIAMAYSLDEAKIQANAGKDPISIQNLWLSYLESIYTIGAYVSNQTYNVPAISAEINGAVGTTTGSRLYNDDDSWAQTKVKFQNYYDSIYAFGLTSPVNSWTKKIGIMIRRDSSGVIVAGGNVGHDEGITAYRMSTGNYTVIYNIHDPIKWNLGVFYFFNNPPCTQCLPTEGPKPLALDEQQSNNLYHFKNNLSFIIPQQEAFKENNTNSKLKKSFLTINDLLNDHFDEELQDYAHSLKSFNVGDSIIVSDTITDIYYDSDKNATSLGFDYWDKTSSNEISKIYWEFNGDLMSRFSIGDSVSFKTEVISINKDLNLETLDILGYQAEVAPNIDSFLLSHLQVME